MALEWLADVEEKTGQEPRYMEELLLRVVELDELGAAVGFWHVRREMNTDADKLANLDLTWSFCFDNEPVEEIEPGSYEDFISSGLGDGDAEMFGQWLLSAPCVCGFRLASGPSFTG